jgi:hypothetical protein
MTRLLIEAAMCQVYDDIHCEFYDARTRVARKQHRCGECRRTIEAGETYKVTAGKWDGDFCQTKTCRHCGVMEEWLLINCDGFVWHTVIEDIYEHAREYGLTSLGRLVVGARRQWKRFNSDELMPVPAVPDLISSSMVEMA